MNGSLKSQKMIFVPAKIDKNELGIICNEPQKSRRQRRSLSLVNPHILESYIICREPKKEKNRR